MKAKLIFILSALVVALSITACTTMTPIDADTSFPSGEKYEILGRVSVSTSQSKSGYSKLLAKAKEQYPEADDIVNIMVDVKKTTFLFIFNSYTYEMTGIAVDYK